MGFRITSFIDSSHRVETYRVVPRKSESFFTGDAVAADAAR